jgi:predicted esterase
MILTGCSQSQWQHITDNKQPEVQTVNEASEGESIEESKPLFTPEPIITPGRYELNAPKSNSSFILWVPLDYDPDYAWPLIFCYHGAGGSATTWPFQQVTNNQGYIIVGMNYSPLEEGARNPQWLDEEKAFFLESLEMVLARLSVDPEMIFMGGYSQGGYHTTLLGEQFLDKLAGLIVLGAGRFFIDHSPPDANKIKGKPIFIGVGEKDSVHNPRAQKAAMNYRFWGAEVTFEEWQGVGHGINTPEFPSKLLFNWLEEIFSKI